MTGRLAGSHHWPWVLLEWPLFGLTKKKQKKNLFDIIAESTLGMMAYLPGGGGGGGVVDNHHCRVNLYFPPTAVSWILN